MTTSTNGIVRRRGRFKAGQGIANPQRNARGNSHTHGHMVKDKCSCVVIARMRYMRACRERRGANERVNELEEGEILTDMNGQTKVAGQSRLRKPLTGGMLTY